jgi:hypothetical protein
MPAMTLFGMYVDDVGNGSHLFDCFVSMVVLYDRYLYFILSISVPSSECTIRAPRRFFFFYTRQSQSVARYSNSTCSYDVPHMPKFC